MRTQDQTNQAATAATAALAAASKTPFRTAFKITIGIALAQLAVATLFFGGLFGFILAVYLIAR